jgi:protein tyrosine/serine phosphatase
LEISKLGWARIG